MSEEQVDYEYPDQHIVSGEEDQNGHENPSSEHNNNNNGLKSNTRHAPNADGVIDNVLFLSKFALSTTVEEFRTTLSKYGPLGPISITSGGTIAFIDFVNAEDCLRAKNDLHQKPGFGTDSLIADFKKPSPRGGGRGGYPRDYRSRDYRDDGFRSRDRDGWVSTIRNITVLCASSILLVMCQ